MSQDHLQKPREENDQKEDSTPKDRDTPLREVATDSEKDESTLLDSQIEPEFGFKTKEDEEDQEDEKVRPLTPDEFLSAMRRIDALGLTWTADRTPAVTSKGNEAEADAAFFTEEFQKIQRDYPHLPRELSAIVFHILTGFEPPPFVVGSEDDLRRKSAIVQDMLITPKFRSEFFFKHAIKVPYLTDIDWEVVLKLSERNVKEMPGISYALLSLIFHNPNVLPRASNRRQTMTVAMNDHLVDKLLSILTEIKFSLDAARQITERLDRQPALEGEDDANINRKRLG